MSSDALTAEAERSRRTWQGWTLAGIGILCAFLILGLIADAFAPGPQGPAESSYATSPAGVAAWAELLGRAGHPAGRLRAPLAGARLAPDSTLIVLGAQSLTPAEGLNLDRFVRAGGRLVIGGGDPNRALPALLSGPPRFIGAGPRIAGPVARAPEVSGVSQVISAGAGAWAATPSDKTLLAGRTGGSLLLARRFGTGTVYLLADAAIVENQLIASADNALLALHLAGEAGRPVVFAESLHGFGAAAGLAAIPGRWWLMFAGLGLAAGTWALARGRRIGPPELPVPAGAPPRVSYVQALGATLIRAHDLPAVVAVARGDVARELDRRLGPSAQPGSAEEPDNLRGLGLSDSEIDIVLGSPAGSDGESELLRVGAVLARLRSGA